VLTLRYVEDLADIVVSMLNSTQPKFKRLKRGHREDRGKKKVKAIGDIFNDEEGEEAQPLDIARPRTIEDEFAGFIEEDFSDEGGQDGEADDADVKRTVHRNFLGAAKIAAGMDEMAIEDLREAFGIGDEYDWALALQEEEGAQQRGADLDDPDPLSKAIELKDVFEPSQLAERMLTDEDNVVRSTDEPERFQIAREPFKHLILTDEEIKEESTWISHQFLLKRSLDRDLHEPFQKSIAKVLEFMTVDEYEVPFIFQHRKDYLIHAVHMPVTPDPYNPSDSRTVVRAEKLLNQSDLWEIFDLDLKFRALVEKRHVLLRTYDNLKDATGIQDTVFEEMLSAAITMEELQDVQDYLHFQHSARLADITIVNGTGTNGVQRRPGSTRLIFERIRHSKVYGLVRAFGISADAFAQNASKREGRRQYTEDPSERPDDMADSDSILDPPDYATGEQCLKAAKTMFAEELVMSPRMRKVMRDAYFTNGVIDCFRTEKGLRRIDDQHPYYEFKYLRNQQMRDFIDRPGRFLKMLKAEEEGLVEVKVRLQNQESFRKRLYSDLESDNYSEIADAWNRERREALDMALTKLDKIMARSVKEQMKDVCENVIGKNCRDEYYKKIDQAPYKPKGMILGTRPRVIALSNGNGVYGRDAICWAWVEEDGRVLENGKFTDLTLGDSERGIEDGADVRKLVELVKRRNPDVFAVSGFSAEIRKLYKQLEDIVETKNLRGAVYEDEDGNDRSDKLEIVIVNDEVARLYQTSERANIEHPGFAPLTKYCVALAKYLQNPMKEYASLGKDIVSISFDPHQGYLPQDKLMKQLESSMVDMVNLCGVEINDAVSDSYTASLLPYICGLGPRKAAQLLKVININGGSIISRAELVADPDLGRLGAVGPKVWNNCASFLYVDFDDQETEADYLDNTRVHPEDYDLGRKMAADALELDEEDIAAETQDNGAGAIVRKLVKDDAQEKVNDLILEEYAEQLDKNFNQRKRATLETIRAELQQPYEELRRNFGLLSTDEIFTMFTGETRESLCEGMIVPISIKKVADDYIEAKLDCGVDGTVSALAISNRPDVSAKQLYSVHQTVRAKLTHLNRKTLTASFSLNENDLRKPFHKEQDHLPDEWDDRQEQKDKDALQEKNDVSGRTQRVIKHPLFRPFNSVQAQEYLGSQARGDVVIRPSSKGPDHLAVTWKVSDNIYQHIDVLELDKSKQLSSGMTLKVGGKHNYSDLDELIVNHVKAMAKKVEEMMQHDKYRNGSKTECGKFSTLSCNTDE
jgi:transcription elongation factor SPT6